MRFSTALPILALAAGLVNAQNNNNQNQNQNQNEGGNGGNNALILNPDNVQDTNDGLADAEPGQAASDTDPANFINLCTGKTLTNGLQNQQGSCNPIPMGDIPAKNKMISAAFVFPKNNDNITLDSDPNNNDMNFQVQITNLAAGSFTNPDDTYYAAPQALNDDGIIIGHTHLVVQDLLGDPQTTTPPDPTVFAFFKGVNDDGNGQGLLSATLTGGLAPGAYRICSMTSASNHQPVLMPVAQRGAQDECVRFQVFAAGGNGNNGGNAGGNNGGQQGGQGGGKPGGQGGGAASATGAAAQASAVAGGDGQGGNNRQRFGKGGQRFGRSRKFTAREFVA